MYIFIVVIIIKYPRLRVRQRTWAKEKNINTIIIICTKGRMEDVNGNQDGGKDQR